MLQVGQSVTVRAGKQPCRPDLVYQAVCASDDGEHIVLKATRTLPAVSIGPATFVPGDQFEEHYWRSRWYSVLKVVDAQGSLKGWYGNIATPAEVRGTEVFARDLDLDLWIPGDGTAMARLDEDEFQSSGLLAHEPCVAAEALRALDELESIVVAGRLESLLSQARSPSLQPTRFRERVNSNVRQQRQEARTLSTANTAAVRQAVAVDIETLAVLFDLYRQFQGQAGNLAAARSFLADRFDHGESIVFIATVGGAAVGFAQLYPKLLVGITVASVHPE
jgi:predicted RNA-binding protein associated with RNAse of E/G family